MKKGRKEGRKIRKKKERLNMRKESKKRKRRNTEKKIKRKKKKKKETKRGTFDQVNFLSRIQIKKIERNRNITFYK